jgi:hypothetical protein
MPGESNPLWGAPRIHGELLKLGIDVGQTSVATYMARHRRPPSQGWKTFLRNHADGIASTYRARLWDLDAAADARQRAACLLACSPLMPKMSIEQLGLIINRRSL